MEQILIQHPWIIAAIIIWTLPWKAAALWRSARRGHFGWFFTLLIINSLAILDILYFFIFSKPKSLKKQDQLEQKDEKAQLEQKIANEQQQSKPEEPQAKSAENAVPVKVMIV